MGAMQLISLNVGHAAALAGGGGRTGIDKRPVAGPVLVDEQGVVGDAVCNRRHHGGPDQAVYVYGQPDYAAWSAVLGRDLPPGTLGDNLTVSHLLCNDLAVGDRLRVGDVLLEVTAPRIPCVTLARHMGDAGFVLRFRDMARPGVYCRVLAGGFVSAGDAVQIEAGAGDRISVLELFRDAFEPTRDPNLIRRYLAAPLAERLRRDKDKQLAKVLRG